MNFLGVHIGLGVNMNSSNLDLNELVMGMTIEINDHITTAYVKMGEKRIEALIYDPFYLFRCVIERIKPERPSVRTIVFMQ
jgi:hypothetical protein